MIIEPTSRRLASSVVHCLRVAAIGGLKGLAVLACVALVGAIVAIVSYRWIDPPGSTLMFGQSVLGKRIDQRWMPLERISPALVRAVIVSEDNQFCHHRGLDLRELKTALERFDDPGRGASTISMQLTKNLVLWPGKSYVRKALELPLTLLMELTSSKRRIMENYLNVVEFGPGVFGAEAAAWHHFRKPASSLTEREATLLAVSLPNPLTRIASAPSPNLLRVAGVIERRVKSMGTRADCVLDGATRRQGAVRR